MKLTPLDWTIILSYFLVTLGIGLFYSRRAGTNLVPPGIKRRFPGVCWA